MEADFGFGLVADGWSEEVFIICIASAVALDGISLNVSKRSWKDMPEYETIKRAEQDREEGKAPSTQAGEFAEWFVSRLQV